MSSLGKLRHHKVFEQLHPPWPPSTHPCCPLTVLLLPLSSHCRSLSPSLCPLTRAFNTLSSTFNALSSAFLCVFNVSLSLIDVSHCHLMSSRPFNTTPCPFSAYPLPFSASPSLFNVFFWAFSSRFSAVLLLFNASSSPFYNTPYRSNNRHRTLIHLCHMYKQASIPDRGRCHIQFGEFTQVEDEEALKGDRETLQGNWNVLTERHSRAREWR